MEIRRDASHAWYTAAFSRAKKLPKLDTILRRIKVGEGDRKPMTWQAMHSAALAWTKALGGKPKKKG